MNTSDLMFPTPTRCGLDGGSNSRRAAKRIGTYPSPVTHGLGGGSGSFAKIESLFHDGKITYQEKMSMQSGCGGRLNPDWVEWLMGLGIGWTDPEVENEDIVYLPLGKDPADDGLMGRLTDRKENRVSRIKALGNGQVPLCAAVAFDYGMFMLDGIQ